LECVVQSDRNNTSHITSTYFPHETYELHVYTRESKWQSRTFQHEPCWTRDLEPCCRRITRV